ncbi:ABC transporter permease [Sphaerisporangium corydalis]|uniref:ABC transporter permease n=1 Tax=Sphaerisporangium corydalis TaxID=1441875 RepID=A0ABV9E9J5_9ACTN|nr:ABC transporter permease [Sphaerisporangium corydalis]
MSVPLPGTPVAPASPPGRMDRPPGPRRRLAAALHRHAGVRLSLLLAAPLAWLGVAYLGSLAALFVTAFWSTDSFTGDLVRTFTWANFHDVLTIEVYRTVALRSLGVAVAVTLIDAVIAFPMAFAMAKLASPRTQRWLVIAVLTPLWASYLVKAYAWRVMLSSDGLLGWGYGLWATIATLSYLWLPYMILPIYAGLERLPDSLLEAAGDLGARGWRAFRTVVWPLTFPAIVAGSVFTFSLSLGDYIAVKIVGGRSQLIGNVVYDNIGAANNLPFAAAVATIPVVIMLVYLAAVRRTGALESL